MRDYHKRTARSQLANLNFHDVDQIDIPSPALLIDQFNDINTHLPYGFKFHDMHKRNESASGHYGDKNRMAYTLLQEQHFGEH